MIAPDKIALIAAENYHQSTALHRMIYSELNSTVHTGLGLTIETTRANGSGKTESWSSIKTGESTIPTTSEPGKIAPKATIMANGTMLVAGLYTSTRACTPPLTLPRLDKIWTRE